MAMKNFENYKREDLIKNSYFIDWVIRPTSRSTEFWNDVRKKHPEIENEIKAAISIIRLHFPGTKEMPEISKREINDLWSIIDRSTISRVSFFRRFRYAFAAVFILLLSVSIWLFNQLYSSSFHEMGYEQMDVPAGIKDNVCLILADKSELKLTNEDSNIIYTPGGKLSINSSKQIIQNPGNTAKSEVMLNQLIVPRGKRSSITLSDGTTIWINSGSRAIYPVKFDKKRREIYVEGEIYLTVAKDENRPFIVRTDKLEIKVLGTSFNVNAYPEDKTVTVVLVRGNIKVKPENHKELNVSPNQALIYTKLTDKSQISNVDIYNYISWKDGWLRCESEVIESVLEKLSRYYSRTFVFEDESLKLVHLSGKLELKDNIDDVLKVVSLATLLRFSKDDDTIKVSKSENN